jgi:hypothetical protein
MARINQNLATDPTTTTDPTTPAGAYDAAEVARINRGGGPQLDWSAIGSRIDMTIRLGLSTRPRGTVSDYKADSPMHRAAKFNTAAVFALEAFARGVQTVLDDETLTPIGKNRRVQEVGREHLNNLDELVKKDWFMPALRKAVEKTKARVQDTIKLPARDDAYAVSMEREVREILRAMDDSQRLAAWREIVKERDPFGISAVIHAPVFAKLLPERVVEEGLRLVTEATDPEAAVAREEALQAINHVELMYADARKLVAEAAGIDISPKLQGLAGVTDADREAAKRAGVTTSDRGASNWGVAS